MNLISWFCGGDRLTNTTLTDMDVVAFYKYLHNTTGNAAIVAVFSIDEQAARRWEAEGMPTVTKQSIRMGEFRNAQRAG